MSAPETQWTKTTSRTGDGVPMPEKLPVAATPISHVRLESLLQLLDQPPVNRAAVVSFCNVHSVTSARRSDALAEALAASDIAAPDGMPVAWWMRLVHGLAQPRIFGQAAMDAALRFGVDRGWRHFMYGSTETTLAQLAAQLRITHPGAVLCGVYAPPFRTLTATEESAVARRIRAAEPTVVWVGLGMPKQELWMHAMRDRLPGTTLAGVGAAFDMLAGTVPPAPRWMRSSGLEWLFRLSKEPRRLWRRYALNNPVFLALLLRELIAGGGDG